MMQFSLAIWAVRKHMIWLLEPFGGEKCVMQWQCIAELAIHANESKWAKQNRLVYSILYLYHTNLGGQ